MIANYTNGVLLLSDEQTDPYTGEVTLVPMYRQDFNPAFEGFVPWTDEAEAIAWATAKGYLPA